MVANKWVVHTATGEFKYGGFYEPTVPDSAHSIITIASETMPNPQTQKWGGSAVVSKSTTELAQAKGKEQAARHIAMSQSRDVVTLCAMLVRSRDIVLWEDMSLPQKLAEIRKEVKAWVEIRQIVDSNFKE